jgi:hypothetical protein
VATNGPVGQEQRQQRSALCNRYPKLGRAIGLRDILQDILADEDPEALRWWCKRAKLSRLEPFRELAHSIQKHWSGVVALPPFPCCNLFGRDRSPAERQKVDLVAATITLRCG